VHGDFSKTPFTLVPPCCHTIYRAAVLHLGKCETTGAVVLCCDEVESFDAFCVFSFADEELGRLLQSDNGDAEDGHDED
jgi:hypothetical protein